MSIATMIKGESSLNAWPLSLFVSLVVQYWMGVCVLGGGVRRGGWSCVVYAYVWDAFWGGGGNL